MPGFIEASAPVPLPPARARQSLAAALANEDFLKSSADLYAEGVTTVQGVGPRALTKRVLVRSLPATDLAGVMVVPIRWEPTGFGRRMFPRLEASVAVVPVNPVTSVLSIAGRYVVPLGRLGEAIDRAALASVAQRSLDQFVRHLAQRMVARTEAGADRARAS